jgi:hypothetical protein
LQGFEAGGFVRYLRAVEIGIRQDFRDRLGIAPLHVGGELSERPCLGGHVQRFLSEFTRTVRMRRPAALPVHKYDKAPVKLTQ